MSERGERRERYDAGQWRYTAVADVAITVFDGPFGSNLKTSDYTSEGVRVMRLENIGHLRLFSDKEAYVSLGKYEGLKRHTLEPNDILFSSFIDDKIRVCLFPGLPTIAINKSDCFCIRVDLSRCSPQFLMYRLACRSTFEQLEATVHGATRPRISLSQLKATEFGLPPLPEQRRIVAKIDSLSAKSKRARDHLDHIPRLVEKYKQAILAAAFRGELTREWRSAHGANGVRWSECCLADIAEGGTGSTPKRGEPRYYEGGNIPWVTSGAVNASLILEAEEFITEVALSETNCKIFPSGTLLMAMYGEGQTRGRVAVLGIDAATNQALAAIRVRPESNAVLDFVFWYLRGNYLELRQKAAGGVQPNLNLGIIKTLRLPVPSDREQREIVRRIENAFAWIDRLATEAKSARKLIEHLDQAVLAKAFRGELVPQDPNDEPASVLQERIIAERQSKPGKAPRESRRTAN